MKRLLTAVVVMALAGFGALLLIRVLGMPSLSDLPSIAEVEDMTRGRPDVLLLAAGVIVSALALLGMVMWSLRTIWDVTVGGVARSVATRSEQAAQARAARAERDRQARRDRRVQAKKAKDDQRSVTITATRK